MDVYEKEYFWGSCDVVITQFVHYAKLASKPDTLPAGLWVLHVVLMYAMVSGAALPTVLSNTLTLQSDQPAWPESVSALESCIMGHLGSSVLGA